MFVTENDSKNYKRWAILDMLKQLKKAIEREWTQERQDRIDNLKKDLHNYD